MLQPSISFSGFTLHEPITVLTDLVLSGFCLYLSFKTGKSYAKFWSAFFLTMSFATLIGALGHGLYIDKNNILQWISRTAGIVSVFWGEIASVMMLLKSRIRSILVVLVSLQLAIAIAFILQRNEFKVVVTNGSIGFGLVVALVQIYLIFKGHLGSKYILAGIAVNAIAGLIHKFQIAPSKWFNHNDLGHVIMIFGLYFIAKGALYFQLNEKQNN
jgi:hypothetical protein